MPAGPVVVQRVGITAATLDDTVKTKGWPEVFTWLNGQPIDFILSWLLSLSGAQFAALQDNMFEMTGNKPRTGIAIDAAGEARTGPPAQSTIDYYESRMRILNEETLPPDQRDWIRALFGVGPNAGKVKALPAAGGAASAAAPAAVTGGGAGATSSGGGKGASTSGYGKGQLTEAQVGTKFPELADEVAKKLFGKDSFTELVQSYKSINVFGRQTYVAEEFGSALLKADAAARPKIEAKEGHAFTDKDWKIGSISGYQANKGGGLHPWGVAVDIDYALNPYIANEAGDVVKGVNVVDKITTPIYHRIALLMLETPRMSLIPGGKVTYDSLAAESQAMVDYFSMRGDDSKVKAWVDKRKDVLDSSMWQSVFGGEDVSADQRATRLSALIADDYTNLSAGPKDEAPTKLPGNVDRPFDPKGGSAKGRDPAKGFLTIRKEVVEALRAQPNVRWGGTDFGAGANGDIMHFDLGKKYNIKGTAAKIRAEMKAEAEAGTTPVQKMADPGAVAPPRQVFLQRHEEGEEDLVEDEILNPPALQRSPIPGASIPDRLTSRAPRLWAETVSRVQRTAGNKAAEAAAMRLHFLSGRPTEDSAQPKGDARAPEGPTADRQKRELRPEDDSV